MIDTTDDDFNDPDKYFTCILSQIQSVIDDLINDFLARGNYLFLLEQGLPVANYLVKNNIDFDEICTCVDDSIEAGSRNNKNVIHGGSAFSFKQNGHIKYGIALKDTPIDIFTPTDKLMALIHELAHVEDMEQSINIKLSEKKVDLLKAEVYAELKTYQYIINMKVSNEVDEWIKDSLITDWKKHINILFKDGSSRLMKNIAKSVIESDGNITEMFKNK